MRTRQEWKLDTKLCHHKDNCVTRNYYCCRKLYLLFPSLSISVTRLVKNIHYMGIDTSIALKLEPWYVDGILLMYGHVHPTKTNRKLAVLHKTLYYTTENKNKALKLTSIQAVNIQKIILLRYNISSNKCNYFLRVVNIIGLTH